METKVELLWDLKVSAVFTAEEILTISTKLSNRISNDGIFSMTAEEARSQLKNKEIAAKKAFHLIENSLIVQKPRKKSKPSFGSVQKRLDTKRKQSLKKINRGTNFD